MNCGVSQYTNHSNLTLQVAVGIILSCIIEYARIPSSRQYVTFGICVVRKIATPSNSCFTAEPDFFPDSDCQFFGKCTMEYSCIEAVNSKFMNMKS